MKTQDNAYAARRTRALRTMNALPRGSRMRAAYDLRVPPVQISNVLNGAILRPDLLALVEDWLLTQDGTKVLS